MMRILRRVLREMARYELTLAAVDIAGLTFGSPRAPRRTTN